jgi:hypothetical protein
LIDFLNCRFYNERRIGMTGVLGMSGDFLIQIIRAVAEGHYKLTEHAIEEAENDRILLWEVKAALLAGELIEDYPEDRRGHSCLILGYNYGRAMHIVCGMREQIAIIITVYYPDDEKWINDRERRV